MLVQYTGILFSRFIRSAGNSDNIRGLYIGIFQFSGCEMTPTPLPEPRFPNPVSHFGGKYRREAGSQYQRSGVYIMREYKSIWVFLLYSSRVKMNFGMPSRSP